MFNRLFANRVAMENIKGFVFDEYLIRINEKISPPPGVRTLHYIHTLPPDEKKAALDFITQVEAEATTGMQIQPGTFPFYL
ncbi:hypothetical protein AYI68_g7566 [Smittium mucronatum]|uniref:Uncharacterized protein n=1 Tax=Smittium mucronatum TaxID=133383 RepID=A0A1R0GNE9_9FUNG|nr:hypothetical protein AYI68_g7566 [Smittium mucronatum]